MRVLQFMKSLLRFVVIFFFSVSAGAYIPSTNMILERTAQNGASVPLYIEQEVLIRNAGANQVRLFEEWWIDGKGQYAVLVRGDGELKNQFLLKIEISPDTQTFYFQNEKKSFKLSGEFIEPLLMSKSKDQLALFLINQGVFPKSFKETLNKKSNHFVNKGKNEGFKYQPEPWVRLARSHGTTAWHFFDGSKNLDTAPGVWIEQDHFRILKFKNNQQVNFRFSQHTTYFTKAKLPANTFISFANSSADLSLVKVKPLNQGAKFKKFEETKAKQTDVYQNHSLKALVEEFYLRFR